MVCYIFLKLNISVAYCISVFGSIFFIYNWNHRLCWKGLITCFPIFAVKHLKIEKNTSQNASHFESVGEKGKDDIFIYLVAHFFSKNPKSWNCNELIIFLQNLNIQRDIFSQTLFQYVKIQVFLCKSFECIELKGSLLFVFSTFFSAKWNQCNPPSFYHRLRVWSLCLSAQSQCTELTHLNIFFYSYIWLHYMLSLFW